MKQGYIKTLALSRPSLSSTSRACGQGLQGSFTGRFDPWGSFLFVDRPANGQPSPIGFNYRSQSQTSTILDNLCEKWEKATAFQSKKRFWLQSSKEARSLMLSEREPLISSRVGFKIREYRSGEMTGGQFQTGRQFKNIPPSRSGPIVTSHLTQPSKTKIRRALECSDTALRYFCTITFAPSSLMPWHLDESGSVRHDFAKYKLRKFLDTCRKHQFRLNRQLNYLWVAEIQTETTGNIHFHILWDQFFAIKWLVKIWAQASNSVDIDTVRNIDQAACYLRKYLEKQDEEVNGNRYFIAHKLRVDMLPKEKMLVSMSVQDNEETGGERLTEVRELLQALKEDIEARGGHVFDFGFHISRPRGKKKYKDRDTGEQKETIGVDPRLARDLQHYLLKDKYTARVPF